MTPHRAERSDTAFTIVEVMIVVMIVAILVLVAMPLMQGHIKASRMSEGVDGAGMVRTALRTYAAGHQGTYPTLNAVRGDELTVLNITADALAGRFFGVNDYVINSSPNSYTIRVTLPTDANYWFQVDQDGNELRGMN